MNGTKATARARSWAPGWAWRSPSRSSSCTRAGSGSRACTGRGLPSDSRSRRQPRTTRWPDLVIDVKARQRVLVVDDVVENCELIAAYLEDLGCDVVTAHSGGEAVAAMETRAAGLDPETVAATYFAARVHDIGKIGVPDEILNKKEALSPEEVAVMRTVPVLGAEICRPLRSSHGITEIIRHQKERVDGTGYPDGLSGEQISPAARILAICDAYDSLVSGERAERPQMADERARAVLLRQSGRAYDAKLVWLLFNKVLPPVSSPVS